MSKTTNDRSEIRQATIELLDLEIPPSDGSQIKGGVIDEFSSWRTLDPSASRPREGYVELVEMGVLKP